MKKYQDILCGLGAVLFLMALIFVTQYDFDISDSSTYCSELEKQGVSTFEINKKCYLEMKDGKKVLIQFTKAE